MTLQRPVASTKRPRAFNRGVVLMVTLAVGTLGACGRCPDGRSVCAILGLAPPR